jgi:hypothetical protein
MQSNHKDIESFLIDREKERQLDESAMPLHWQSMQDMLHSQASPLKPKGGASSSWLKMLLFFGGALIVLLFMFLLGRNKSENNHASTNSKDTQQQVVVLDTIVHKTTIRTDTIQTGNYYVIAPKGIQVFTKPTPDVRFQVLPVNKPHDPVNTPPVTVNYGNSKAMIDALFAPLQKGLQAQTIDADQPAEMILEKGTRLIFPANVFVHSNGQTVDGKIEVEAAAYLNANDLMTVRQQTSSEKLPLETAGTCFVQARQNGQTLQLAKGKQIVVQFPSASAIDKMELFYLDTLLNAAGAATIDWVAANQTGIFNPYQKPNGIVLSTVVRQPQITLAIAEGSFDYLETFEGDTSAINYLNGFPANYFNRAVFYIDDALNRNNTQIELQQKYPCLKRISFRRFSKKWREEFTPNMLHNRTARKFMGIKKNPSKRQLNRANHSPVEGISSNITPNNSFDQLVNAYQQSNIQFTLNRLQWINCDRFSNVFPRNNMVVELADSIQTDYCAASLVFDDTKSILPGTIVSPNKIMFYNVPVGKQVKFFIVANRKGKLVQAVSNMITNQRIAPVGLALTNMQTVKETISKFNW